LKLRACIVNEHDVEDFNFDLSETLRICLLTMLSHHRHLG
jgi:hypothetical protein